MLSDFYKGKKVLITGHTGFCGSWLSRVLLYWGADVVGYALPPKTKPALFEVLQLANQLKNYLADINDFSQLKTVLENEKPNIIFHLAAQPIVFDGYRQPKETFEVNTMGTVNVLEATRQTKTAKAVVVITTDKVYQDFQKGPAKEDDALSGSCPYSASKAAAEIVARSYQKFLSNSDDFNFLIATSRAGNILGGGDWGNERLAPDIIRAVFEQKTSPVLRSPQAVRPWQFVLEALWGYLLLAEKLFLGQADFATAWNFGPDLENCLTVGELTKKLLLFVNQKEYTTNPSLLKEEKLLTLNNQKAKICLNWQPILTIDEILDWTFQWYAHFYQGGDMAQFTLRQIETFFDKTRRV